MRTPLFTSQPSKVSGAWPGQVAMLCRRMFVLGGVLGKESKAQGSCGQVGSSASLVLLDCVFVVFGQAWSQVQVPKASRLLLSVVLTQWVISSFTF